MEIDAGTFRRVMGHFATGITVVTTIDADRPQGITVNGLSSVSLDPPLVMVALDRARFITPMVRAAGRFAVNVLGEDQQALSECFAHARVSPGREEFCGAPWRPGATGMPLLEGTIATLECVVIATVPAGDHDLFIGRVEALDHAPGTPLPLIYFRRHYRRVQGAADGPVGGKPEP